uniref:Uncharacterized protein n=1 Tax=Nelumbo nucifera TaxID=4432 RepID=A0A822XFC4_NELNU|nr:TPA_asm: hypothetical protein HUJ06_019244 [Nelumbo nucifera]
MCAYAAFQLGVRIAGVRVLNLSVYGGHHFVCKDVEERVTVARLHRKLGNLPPKPAPFKPPAFTPSQDEDSKSKDKTWIDEKTEEELEELEDDPDLDDDRFLEEYRKKRLAEMREAGRISKFGSVIPISGANFVFGGVTGCSICFGWWCSCTRKGNVPDIFFAFPFTCFMLYFRIYLF